MKQLTPWTTIIALVVVALISFSTAACAKSKKESMREAEVFFINLVNRLTVVEMMVGEVIPQKVGEMYAEHEIRIRELEEKLKNCKCGAQTKVQQPQKRIIPKGQPNC